VTPETVLKPLLKHFDIPPSVVNLLYLLLLREIQKDYPSLDYTPEFETDHEEPALRYAKGLIFIFERLPKIYDVTEGKLSATLFNVSELTLDDATEVLYDLCTPVHQLRYEARRERYEQIIASSYDTFELRNAKDQLKKLKEPKITPHLTQFWRDLLFFNVSFELPYRNEHCHILGAQGTGKTSLIKKLVYQDMQTDAAVIVMAPKGNLITTLAGLPSDRTIWVKDWSEVGLNLLDLDPSLFVWVLESLLESEPTSRQKAFLLYCTKHVKNLTELKAFLQKKPPDEFKDVPMSISWRLGLIPEDVEQIFSRPTNIDIRDVMDSGKVLLLDTKRLGEAGSPLIGRCIVALISLCIKKRKNKRFCYVYLDEFPQYVTDHVAYMLDMAREANVCLHLAHQTLAQLTPRLKASVHNSAIKFVSRCNASDAAEMGREIRVDAEVLQSQPRLQFMFYGLTKPFPIKINWDDVDRIATTYREHFRSPHVEHGAPLLLKAVEPEKKYTPDEKKGPWKW
jgi:hypothetical protein